MTVYKLVRIKEGTCYPLFIDKRKPFKFGTWMKSEFHQTKGFSPRSLNGFENPIGGWHCCYQPIAPHLSETLANGEQRVWIECEAKGMMTRYERPESQGGAWLLVEYLRPLRILDYSEVKNFR